MYSQVPVPVNLSSFHKKRTIILRVERENNSRVPLQGPKGSHFNRGNVYLVFPREDPPVRVQTWRGRLWPPTVACQLFRTVRGFLKQDFLANWTVSVYKSLTCSVCLLVVETLSGRQISSAWCLGTFASTVRTSYAWNALHSSWSVL